MKGIFFTFEKSRRGKRHFFIPRIPDFKYFFRRYGIKTVFALLLFAGMAAGALYAKNADTSMLDSLDFLFTTNLDARLHQSTFGTFRACFASDFLFIFLIYLFGLSPWGIPFSLALVLFKGFGTGITAGYLYINHSLAGVGFYLLVLLPGTFIFCLALVMFSETSFCFSKNMFILTVTKTSPAYALGGKTASYSTRFLIALSAVLFASILDTLLWTLFAGAFNF